MKINDLTYNELIKEINRAKFWVEQNSIMKSMELINKMENRKFELHKERFENKNLNEKN